MSILPTELPEIRSRLLERLGDERYRSAFVDLFQIDPVTQARFATYGDNWVLRAYTDAGARFDQEIETLQSAELLFVNRDMTELSVKAGRTLPTFKIEEHDVPFPTGFMAFDEPIFNTSDGENVSAISWRVGAASYGEELRTSIWFTLYSDTSRIAHSRTVPERYAYFDFGLCLVSSSLESADSDAGVQSIRSQVVRTAVSAWLIMQQPLVEVAEVTPDRAARKRIRRAGQEPQPVRVINLRRPRETGEGVGTSNYHHQWVVRGHWRQHWYPKLQLHRPVWIAPHIKGPEGAPLIGGEKVYAWKR